MIYVALLRGINVGGKNKISMADLKICFEDLGYNSVSTYINSGNILFSSSKSDHELASEIEAVLVQKFKFDSEIIKTLVLPEEELKKIIDYAPKGFGAYPDKYHSDVAFLIDGPNEKAINEFELRDGVDTAWPGSGVVYFQRLSSERTKSKLGKIVSRPIYKSLTIRTWTTVNKIYDRMSEMG